MDEIYKRFRNYVVLRSLILPGERILLSLSAGKDSMFMLHLIMKLKDEMDFQTGIFHLNHLTRGIDSDLDEKLVIEKAEQYKIPCHIERFDFKQNRVKGISFEEQARNTRYMLLNTISGKNHYGKIATAHNKNDNAETVLMRILSGTGIAGIKGILPATGNIIRPVLFADKNEIYDYLKKNGIVWREDLSNMESGYLRNYTRNKIIPAVNERFSDAEENLSNLAMHAVENQQLLYGLADTLYPDAVLTREKEVIIDINDFFDNIPLIKLFISRILSDHYGLKMKISIYDEIIRRYTINSANKILYENERVSVRKGLYKERIAIFVADREDTAHETVCWEYELVPGDDSIYIDEIKKNIRLFYIEYDYYINNRDLPGYVFLQPGNDIQKFIIRNRRDGDRIRLESGTKKIKKLMIEKKLDSNTKKNIPLLMADDQIAAYLPGIVSPLINSVACNFRIKNNTKRILAFFITDY